MLEAGFRLGPYEILARLGAGGMGEVYRALDTRLGREVAIKVLPPEYAQNPDRQARFDREARAVAALSHPNILSLHDYGHHDGVAYAVMELLQGQTLRSRLRQGPLPLQEVLQIGHDLADGLSLAHGKGIIHRDLKPENLFLLRDGRVKILDFGLARLQSPLIDGQAITPSLSGKTETYVHGETTPGLVMGTIGYMSPEQVRGQSVEASSDLFSLGCVLYEMTTGKRAFKRTTSADTLAAILHEEPEKPASTLRAPSALWSLIQQCLKKNPDERIESALMLKHELGIQKQEAHRSSRLSPAGKIILAALAGCLLVTLGLLGANWLHSSDHPSIGVQATVTDVMNAIAVLPFENIGGEEANEYLSDGLADHLIDSLSQLQRRELKVRPFSSVARYKQNKVDFPKLARELNVRLILTGTLRQISDNLTINLELVNPSEANRIWGKRYQGKKQDILGLQDSMARDVAKNLQLNLSNDEVKRLTRRGTQDSEAYLLYREAFYHFSKYSEEGLKTAIEYCERALKKDPNFAAAYAKIAHCNLLMGTMYLGPKVTYPKARQYVDQAQKLDPQLQEARYMLSVIYLYHDWNWPNALTELKQLVSSNHDARYPYDSFYGYALASQSRLTEALAAMQRGKELDPKAAHATYYLARAYLWNRQYDQAIVVANQILEIDPKFFLAYSVSSVAYAHLGKYAEALAELEKGRQLANGHPRIEGLIGYVHALAGDTAKALAIASELEKPSPRSFGRAFNLAQIYTAIGNLDKAFFWLEKALEERDTMAVMLNVDPTLDKLRSDPRFAKLVKQMGLPS